jgi:hypothetical protein
VRGNTLPKEQTCINEPVERRAEFWLPLMGYRSYQSMRKLSPDHRANLCHLDEALALANEKGVPVWKASGLTNQGCVMASIGKASEAIELISTGRNLYRPMGDTMWLPSYLSYLARAYADIGQFDDAWRCTNEAIEQWKEPRKRFTKLKLFVLPGK